MVLPRPLLLFLLHCFFLRLRFLARLRLLCLLLAPVFYILCTCLLRTFLFTSFTDLFVFALLVFFWRLCSSFTHVFTRLYRFLLHFLVYYCAPVSLLVPASFFLQLLHHHLGIPPFLGALFLTTPPHSCFSSRLSFIATPFLFALIATALPAALVLSFSSSLSSSCCLLVLLLHSLTILYDSLLATPCVGTHLCHT